jgi:hypothetical protein
MGDKSRADISGDVYSCYRVVNKHGLKWICFLRLQQADTVVLGASDGINIWCQSLRQPSTTDISRLRATFLGSDIAISCINDELTVSLSLSSDASQSKQYVASKLTTSDCQAEMKSLLFSLAEKSVDLEAKCCQSEKMIETLKRNAASGQCNVFDMTSDAKKKKTQPKMQPKQSGMSVLNPGSKKRSKAKGVEFD